MWDGGNLPVAYLLSYHLNYCAKQYIIVVPHIGMIWGRNGFDGVVEAEEAGSGFSLATLKNGKIKINADKQELALAA